MENTTTTTPAFRIETLLEEVVKRNASDLHLQVGLPPMFRIDGTLVGGGEHRLTPDMVKNLIHSVLDAEQEKVLSRDKELDFSFAFGDSARFRVNAFHEKGNLAGAFRLIPKKIPTLDELGIPAVVESFANYPRGLVLVTGPTGSGKTTTLAALLNKINIEKAVHIITIEDPIEYTYVSRRSVVAQREVHYDTFSFTAALRSSLRQDPDVVLVGEMRDLETISSAITLAETGHLVFATLHTNSAAQSIDRIVDIFPASQQPLIRSQLANILMAVCSQRLLPSLKGGRTVAAEIMIANNAVRSIIREGKSHQLDAVIQTSIDVGMQSMDRTLAKMVQQGILSYDDAREAAVDLSEFERLVK
ncbi:MAG: type IV pilus twitching motility protein PilT [Candidatus Nomurabacteria bacterium]|jgi:twitching motility protein PilT|nr:type IV pilus twitching motility protein PilT [Candidatus Nomurabacteria bacterium]